MLVPLVVEPHEARDIETFAKLVNISQEKAGFIEHMRDHYIKHEHDYVRAPRLKTTIP